MRRTSCIGSLLVATLVGDLAAGAVEFRQLSVEVRDADGAPVSSATVTPRWIGWSSGTGYWFEDRDGPAPKLLTDAEGRATVPYPTICHDEQPTSRVTLQVEHPGHCFEIVEIAVGGELAAPPAVQRISLQAGRRLRLRAVDAQQRPVLDDLHVVMAIRYLPVDFRVERQPDGTWLSPPLKDEWNWFRVVRFPPNGPAEFSRMLRWSPADPSSLDQTVALAKGVRVSGRLDDIVPRPVVNGRVIVDLCDWRSRPDAWNWSDWTPVSPNGEFTFESLPPDIELQLSAICRGYVSAPDTPERLSALHNRFGAEVPLTFGPGNHFPQLFDLAETPEPLTLRMHRACAARVTVKTLLGRPAPGVRVACSPNIRIIGGGNTLIGDRWTTRTRLLQPDDRSWQRMPVELERVADADGTVEFDTLPAGRVWCQLYTLADGGREFRLAPWSPEPRLSLRPDQPASVEFWLNEISSPTGDR